MVRTRAILQTQVSGLKTSFLSLGTLLHHCYNFVGWNLIAFGIGRSVSAFIFDGSDIREIKLFLVAPFF